MSGRKAAGSVATQFLIQLKSSLPTYLLSLTILLSFGLIPGDCLAFQLQTIEDFESYAGNKTPYEWKRVQGRRLIDVPRELDRDRDYFEVVSERSNNFVRVFVDDESTQIVRVNGEGFDWNTRDQPYLSWDWRALELPAGANESRRETNDSGAAVYVTFSRDFLGRPRSIKYVYSSSLPVGTVVSYGRLVVVVATSGLDQIGDWKTVVRDVRADYAHVFGGDAPNRPLSITLWGDSDDTHSRSRVDFDNIRLTGEKQ